MLVGLHTRNTEAGIHEGHRGQLARGRLGRRLDEELRHRLHRVRNVRWPEDRRGGKIGEEIDPGDVAPIEQVHDGAGDRLVPTRRREDLRGRQVPERGRRQGVGAVGEGGPDHRGEIPIVDREGLRQRVVEGQVPLVVEPHRVVVGRRLQAVVVLLGGVVHENEPVVRARHQRRRRTHEVRFGVAARPLVLQVRRGAVVLRVEGEHGAAVIVDVRVAAGQIAAAPRAGEPVHAGVVERVARARPVRAAWHVRQRAEVVVEGVVLLHEHDHVLDAVQVTCGLSG